MELKTLFCVKLRGSQMMFLPDRCRVGGIIGHEVLTAMSRRFPPLTQVLAVGYMEALPCQPIQFIAQKDRSESSSLWKCAARNHAERAVFHDRGRPAGLRAVEESGQDGSRQERSNRLTQPMGRIGWLNRSRQFLFRNSDIGK
jgi:hypothetical protein